ncbi:725_t:CDS:2 [Paraglomus occultum]|uniref:725_t:CDS:1 n=1 Tax=Paraglomus occultum TaxID=144539 RepID=A0A9N9A1T2_9GLOM|nr:725_t:CDS:2 [Paraglomus occultum]
MELYSEISRLALTNDEKAALRAHFIKNPAQKAEAADVLPTCGNDDEKIQFNCRLIEKLPSMPNIGTLKTVPSMPNIGTLKTVLSLKLRDRIPVHPSIYKELEFLEETKRIPWPTVPVVQKSHCVEVLMISYGQ